MRELRKKRSRNSGSGDWNRSDSDNNRSGVSASFGVFGGNGAGCSTYTLCPGQDSVAEEDIEDDSE